MLAVIIEVPIHSTTQSLKEWVAVHESLSKTIRRAAKVALGKDVSKVQHYTMSGVYYRYSHSFQVLHALYTLHAFTYYPCSRGGGGDIWNL